MFATKLASPRISNEADKQMDAMLAPGGIGDLNDSFRTLDKTSSPEPVVQEAVKNGEIDETGGEVEPAEGVTGATEVEEGSRADADDSRVGTDLETIEVIPKKRGRPPKKVEPVKTNTTKRGPGRLRKTTLSAEGAAATPSTARYTTRGETEKEQKKEEVKKLEMRPKTRSLSASQTTSGEQKDFLRGRSARIHNKVVKPSPLRRGTLTRRLTRGNREGRKFDDDEGGETKLFQGEAYVLVDAVVDNLEEYIRYD